MKKGYVYIIIGSSLILTTSLFYFLSRGKSKSKLEK